LLNSVPEKILFYGTATFGDGQTPAQVTMVDYFLGHFLFTTPFEFAWGADTVKFDTIKFIITPEDADDELKDEADSRAEKEGAEVLEADYMNYLKSANIQTTITTRLPIGMDLVFKISEDSTLLFESPDVIVGPLQVPKGNPATLGAPATLTSEIGLDESEMDIFKNTGDILKTLFFGAELFITGTNGEIVQVFASDFITVESMGIIITNIDLEDEEN
jgi:hypothetical protein